MCLHTIIINGCCALRKSVNELCIDYAKRYAL